MSTPAIDITGLRYVIGTTVILDDVSFRVDAGQYVSVIGPNGAGKTSLIRCINRLSRTQSGRIDIFGRSLSDYSQRDLAKVISYVPQADARYFPFSVYEFVLMGRYPHLSPFSSVGPEDRAKVDEALKLTGAAAFSERSLRTLSGGERQSVFIAAALTQGARILLLDEPTTFLDYKHQVEVLALLRRLNEQQDITIVAVTHDVNSAVLTSDRVLALKGGRVAFDGTPGDLIGKGVLEEVYDTGFELVPRGDGGTPIVVPTGDGE